MTTKLATLINQIAADDAAERRQQAIEEQQYWAALRTNAEARLASYFGDYTDELLPLIYDRGETPCRSNRKNNAIRFAWHLGSHELQLAPAVITWTEDCTTLEFTLSNGKVYSSAHIELPELLLLMNQSYPDYKAKIDELNQRKAREEADALDALISRLAYPTNWRAHRTEEEVQDFYRQLVHLGCHALADEKLAAYQADVVAVTRRQQEAAARQAAYQAALAQYQQQMAAYQAACRQWAETEQQRLWQPWTLWQVRYTPWHNQCSVEDVDRFPIEVVYTLDAPEDIVNSANPVARVDMVDSFGGVTEDFAIATFLDAKPVHFAICPPIDEGRAHHHRTIYAGDYAVNIPPFVLEEPAPAPVRPNAPSKDADSDQW